MHRRIQFLCLLFISLCGQRLIAQELPEGIWLGYNGELQHVRKQLIALAEATPAEKYTWRPAPGVRSTSEVYMHIALGNYFLLSVTGPKMPDDAKLELEKTLTSKPEVVAWLKRSFEAVETAHAKVTPAEMKRHVKIYSRNTNVDGIYLRILVHDSEHMGQLIAYARMTGVVPPWSK